jgi:cysteine-rich repeat protein
MTNNSCRKLPGHPMTDALKLTNPVARLRTIVSIGVTILGLAIGACGTAVSGGTDGQSHWVKCAGDDECEVALECRQGTCQYRIDSGAEAGAESEPDSDCDDGSTGCANVARLTCGDGELTDDELCDDGNNASGDGCSLACQVEAGFTCVAPGRACVPRL